MNENIEKNIKTPSNIAFIFPGQGSQVMGMGKVWSETYTHFNQLFDQAHSHLGYDLRPLIWEQEPIKTDIVQLSLYIISCGLLELISHISPIFFAGHSLGEITALYAAKSITFKQGLDLIKARGSAMQNVCEKIDSRMLACIGQGDADALAASSGCQVANYNSSSQVVLSGLKECIDKAINLANQFGFGKTVPLNTAGAYHCSLMYPAALELDSKLDALSFSFKPPQVPLVANCTAALLKDENLIRTNVIKQLYSPVLWRQSIEFMCKQNTSHFIEIGQGLVLTKMLQRDGISAQHISELIS